MSSQDWMRFDHHPQPKPEPRYSESTIWTLRKLSRTAEARLRIDAGGRELRVLVDGSLLWSERARAGVDLYALADETRAKFCERGWI